MRVRAAIALVASLLTASAAWAGPTREAVQKRGMLRCGVQVGLAGFGIPDSQGRWTGLDTDICRAVAAAVLGDAAKVDFVPLSAQSRFTALQSGEIDLLSRNTTWSLSRDAGLGLMFTVPVFYDGQGFLVPKALGVGRAIELDGATICTQSGTTNELNLADFARREGIHPRVVVYEKLEDAIGAFFSGRCDAFSTDASGLASLRAVNAPDPEAYRLLPDIISKEPLAPAVRQGDDEWFHIVRWTIFALIEAEERGITQASSVGLTASGEGLGLDDRWAVRVVKAVGNYGEIFARNLGPDTPFRLERGVNAPWSRGGLMIAPPFR